MALKDKLGALTQKIETEKQVQAQEKENLDLKPIRLNIKKLDKEKKNLEIIKGSLDFKAVDNSTNNEGMQDYSLNTEKGIKTEEDQLDSLIVEHKEALASVGIENREQLISNPDYTEEEEVVDYKKALERGEDLKISDAKLKEKLQSYGIEIDDDNFSYEAASRAVEEKLKLVTSELINEKLKTPEGREDITKDLTEEFEKNTGELQLHSSSIRDKSIDRGNTNYNHDESFGINLGKDSFYVERKDDKTMVNRWLNIKLVPDNFEQAKEIYGLEITELALEKAYQNKVHNAFVAWNEKKNNVTEDEAKHENIVFDAVKNVIAAQLKRKELAQEIQEGGTEIGSKILFLESKVEKMARNKKEAIKMIDAINDIQADLPQEESIRLEGNCVFIESIEKEYYELGTNLPLKKKALEAKKSELAKQEISKPTLFGKDKWQKNLDALKIEKNELENEYNELAKKDSLALWKKVVRTIGADEYSDVGNKIRAHKANGVASEVFNSVKAELMEIVDEELPADLMQKYNEYKNLEAKLIGKA